MTDRQHIADSDLALYAMGSLTPGEMDATRSHLLVCEQCKEELRQNQIALAAYSQTTEEVAPPEGAKDRFLAKLATTPQLQAQPLSLPESEPEATILAAPQEHLSLWGAFTRFVSANFAGPLAGALAILLIAVAMDDVRFREALHNERIVAKQAKADSVQLAQLMELLTAAHAKRVVLHQGSVASPPPEGKVVYDANSGKLLLSASNLQPLPAGKTYELWILQPAGNKPLAAGTFKPDATGNAAIILAQAPVGLNVQGFGVTIENAGGSDTPTLPIVLSGS
ncbi:MAG: anti-sigma factor [Terracidiphilus sp.]